MREEQAAIILEERVAAGYTLQVAGHADFRAIKELQQRCLDAEIPAILGPCSKGG